MLSLLNSTVMTSIRDSRRDALAATVAVAWFVGVIAYLRILAMRRFCFVREKLPASSNAPLLLLAISKNHIITTSLPSHPSRTLVAPQDSKHRDPPVPRPVLIGEAPKKNTMGNTATRVAGASKRVVHSDKRIIEAAPEAF